MELGRGGVGVGDERLGEVDALFVEEGVERGPVAFVVESPGAPAAVAEDGGGAGEVVVPGGDGGGVERPGQFGGHEGDHDHVGRLDPVDGLDQHGPVGACLNWTAKTSRWSGLGSIPAWSVVRTGLMLRV